MWVHLLFSNNRCGCLNDETMYLLLNLSCKLSCIFMAEMYLRERFVKSRVYNINVAYKLGRLKISNMKVHASSFSRLTSWDRSSVSFFSLNYSRISAFTRHIHAFFWKIFTILMEILKSLYIVIVFFVIERRY